MRSTYKALSILVALAASARADPSAEQLYNEGQQAYDHGDYPTAISKWTESYQLSRLPLLTFNIAQAHRLAGDCRDALAAYKQFLVEDPAPGQQHDLAVSFTAALTPKCGTTSIVSVSKVEPRRDDGARTDRGRGPSKQTEIGLVTVGGGVALLVTGGYFGHEASLLGTQVTNTCATGCDWAVEKQVQARGRRDQTFQWVFLAAGAVATGVGTWLTYEGVTRARDLPVALVPTRGGATAVWSGSW